MKNKIIKYSTIIVCILLVILVLIIILTKNNSTSPKDDVVNPETSTGTTEHTDPTNPDIDASKNDDGNNNTDTANGTTSSSPTNPSKPDDNDGKPLNPDAIVVPWDEIKYPKAEMQKIIDQIARANAVLESKTGESVFTMKTQDISTKGMVVYVSEYGKYNLFPQNIQNIGGRDMVSYPDGVIFGFAMFLGGNFKPEEMNEWEEDHEMWRDKLTKATTYRYPEEEPIVTNTFEFISCADVGTSIDMTVAGKGDFAGSNYVLRLHQQFNGLWAVLSLTKI